MDFVQILKGIYYNAEDKWYDFLDFLDHKQIPVYKIIDPIDRVVPSFLLFILTMIFVLIFVAYILQFNSPTEFTFTTVDSVTRQTLSGTLISGIIDEEEFSKVTLENGEAKVIILGKSANLFEKIISLFFAEEDVFDAVISAERSGYVKVEKQRKDLSSKEATITLTALIDTNEQFLSSTIVELVDNDTGARIIDSTAAAYIKYSCSNKGISQKTSFDGYDGVVDGAFKLVEPNCGFVVKSAYSPGYEALNGVDIALPSTQNLNTIQLIKLNAPTTGVAKIYVTEKNSSPLVSIPNIQINLLDLMGNTIESGITDYSGVFSKDVLAGTYVVTATSLDGNYYSIDFDANQIIVVNFDALSEKEIQMQKMDPTLARFLKIKVVDYNGRTPLKDVKVFPQKLIVTTDGNRTTRGSIGSCSNFCRTDINGLITISGLSEQDEQRVVVSLFKEDYLAKIFEPVFYKTGSTEFQTVELKKADYSPEGNAGKGLVVVKAKRDLRPLLATAYMYFDSLELNISNISLIQSGIATNASGEALFNGLEGSSDRVYHASANFDGIIGNSIIKAVDVNQLVIFDINIDTEVSFLEVNLVSYNGAPIVGKNTARVTITSPNSSPETLSFNSSSSTFKSRLHDRQSQYSLSIDLNDYVPITNNSVVLSQFGSNLVTKVMYPSNEGILAVFHGLYEKLNANEALDEPGVFLDLNNKLDSSTNGYYAKISYVLGKNLIDGNILGAFRVNNKMNINNISYITPSYLNKYSIYSCTPQEKLPYNDDNYYIQSTDCEKTAATLGRQISAMWDKNASAGVYNVTTKLVFAQDAKNTDIVDFNYSGKKNDFNFVFENVNRTSYEIGAPMCTYGAVNPSCPGVFFYSELNNRSLETERFSYDSSTKRFYKNLISPYEIEKEVANLLKIKVFNNYPGEIDVNLKVYAYNSSMNSFNFTPNGFLHFDSLSGVQQKTIGSNISVNSIDKSNFYDVNVFTDREKISSYIVVVAQLKTGENYFLFINSISPGRKLFLLNSPFLSGVPDQVFDAEVLSYTTRLPLDVGSVEWRALRNCADNNVAASGTADILDNYFSMLIPGVYDYHRDCLKIKVKPLNTFYDDFDGVYLAGTGGITDPTLSCITPSLVDAAANSQAYLQWGASTTLSIRNNCFSDVNLQIDTRLVTDGTCAYLSPSETCTIKIDAQNKEYSDSIMHSDILGVFPIYIKAKLSSSNKKFSLIKTLKVHVANVNDCFALSKDTFDLVQDPNDTAFVLTDFCQYTEIKDYFIPKAQIDLGAVGLDANKPIYNNIKIDYEIIVTGGAYTLTQVITPRTRVRLDYFDFAFDEKHEKISLGDFYVAKYTNFHFDVPSDINVISEDIQFKWVDNKEESSDGNYYYGAKIDGNYIVTYSDGTKRSFTPKVNFDLVPQAHCVGSGGECLIGVDNGLGFEDAEDTNMLYGLIEDKFTRGQIKSIDFNIIGNAVDTYLQIQTKLLVDYNEISYVAVKTGDTSSSVLSTGSFLISPVEGATFLVRNYTNPLIDSSVTEKAEFCKKFLTNTGWISENKIYWTNKFFVSKNNAETYCSQPTNAIFSGVPSSLVSSVSNIPESLLLNWNDNIESFNWINALSEGFWTNNCADQNCEVLIKKPTNFFENGYSKFMHASIIDSYAPLCVQNAPNGFNVNASICSNLGIVCDTLGGSSGPNLSLSGTCIDSKPIIFDSFQSEGFIAVDNPRVEVNVVSATTNTVELDNSAVALWVEGGILKATFLGADYAGYNDKTIEMNIVQDGALGDRYGLLRIIDYVNQGKLKTD